jgi:Tetratricopeptide repeat
VAALVSLLDAQGQYDEAEALYRRALTIFKRVYGPDHYELVVTCNNLAANP